ncbi:MAG: radical SAM protein [Thermoplasmata archaeon]
MIHGRPPRLIFWETTRSCPLRCRHCRAGAGPAPQPGELSTAEGFAWMESVARWEAPRPILVLTGGDLLARPDHLELVARARALGLSVAVSPSVSDRLTPALMRRWADLGISAVSFSLDGASAASHDAHRGVPGTFQATWTAIAEAEAAGLRVQVNTTVLPDRRDELPALFELLKLHRVPVWEVFFLVRTGRAEALAELSPAEYGAVAHLLYDASRYGIVVRAVEGPWLRRVRNEREAGAAPPAAGAYPAMAARLRHRLGPPTHPSSIAPAGTLDGDGVVFVAHDGTITPGGLMELPIGTVLADDLKRVYQEHPLLQAIRARRFSGPCGRCPARSYCGGSRARALAATGDPLGSDPACPFGPSAGEALRIEPAAEVAPG